MNIISLGKISDETQETYKVKLQGEVLDKFRAYLSAYQQSYQQTICPEVLISKLLEMSFNKDSKFKAWYAKHQAEHAVSPA